MTDLTSLTASWKTLPAWFRWAAIAAGGVLLLSIVQAVSGTELLTGANASSGMLRWSMPILFAGLGGLFSERVGVVNIGLEGMMVLGTWCGAMGAIELGPWGGLVAGMIGGALGGLLHAVSTVQFGVDHIISGVAINILAPGLARFLSDRFFPQRGGSISQSPPGLDGLGDFTVPVLSDGFESIADWDVFFVSDMASVLQGFVTDLKWFTLIGLLLVPASSWLLFKTRIGLRMRICGENPHAGESLGVDIYKHKYLGVVLSGALAGLAGAFIVIELTGLYRGGQTQGRGFIGLAALIFGNWRAGGILTGALLFGYPFALSLNDFDASGSGVGTRALLLLVAVALLAFAVWSWRTEREASAAEPEIELDDSPTSSYIRMVRGLGSYTNTALASGMGLIILVWYLLTERAAEWVPNTMPYALVLIVLVFASQNLKMPAADGLPFRKGET
jgi:simple sugar transport system permease protein